MEIAQDALIEARANFDYGTRPGPVAVYRCDDCDCYHLTSKGEMNPALAGYIRDGRLKRDREAKGWLDKLKRR